MRSARQTLVAGLIVAVTLVLPARADLVFDIEAPESLVGEAARLEALQAIDLAPFLSLIGLEDEGDPIRIVLVAGDSEFAERVPPWIAGFAQGERSLVVLFPERVPSYPYSSLAELVRHEVAHVLIHRASDGAPLPRWFHEGLAMTAEGSWRMADRSRLAMAMLRSREPTLDELSGLFAGDEQRIAWAYAVSGALVRDLLAGDGRRELAPLLARTGAGIEFSEAFESSFGEMPSAALEGFWRRSRLWYRWLPFLTSSTVLWIAVTILALVAIRRRRERDRRIRQAWEVEEELLQLESEAPEDLVN